MASLKQLVAGVDEVGRGCIFGPVVVAAVILDPDHVIPGLRDSKQLAAEQRLVLAEKIQKNTLSWAIGRAEASEVDRINILQASLLAMQRAIQVLRPRPDWVRVDGSFYPETDIPGESIIKGDQLHAEISAASILAKVARDNEMALMDVLYPGYQFARHKGYPTVLHKKILMEKGITPVHRKSYAPVKKLLQLSS